MEKIYHIELKSAEIANLGTQFMNGGLSHSNDKAQHNAIKNILTFAESIANTK